jgi:hypothetical protein
MGNGSKRRLEISIVANKTGITALFCNASFFVTSYKPNKIAEKSPRRSHIKRKPDGRAY